MATKKITIVHVVYLFETGGVESLLVELLNGLDKNKFNVLLVTLTNDQLKMIPLLNNDVIVYNLNFKRDEIKTFSGVVLSIKNLIELLNNISPDILHIHHSFLTTIYVSVAIKLSKTNPLLFRTVHEIGSFYDSQKNIFNKIKLFCEQISFKINKTYIISISKTVQKNNIKYFQNVAKDIKLIYNGINLDKFNKDLYLNINKTNFDLKYKDFVISYVARFDNGKNHDYLIEIWEEIKKEIPNAILCFAGDGFLKEQLLKRVNERNFNNSIKFFGTIPNVYELLAISDLGVFPSSHEGFGLVLLEKFSMQLPVVASNIDTFREIATHKEDVFLVELNDKREFVNSVVKLAKNKQLSKQISNKAFLKAQKFSIHKTIKSYENYYSNAIEKNLND